MGTDFGASATAGKQVMNKFGTSSAFKAVRLASGGLSGGLSSAIAGGSPDSYREERRERGVDNEWVESCDESFGK